MATSAGELASYGEHMAGAAIPDFSPTKLVNDAGTWLLRCHSWKFLSRPPLALRLGAGTVSGLIPLPADISELAGVPCGHFNGRALMPATEQGIIDAKARGIVPFDYFAAITYAASTAIGGGAPTPNLLLWPEPIMGSGNTDTAIVYYRSGWIPLVDDEDMSSTPDWFDPLLIQAVRGYFKGIQTNAMEVELAKVRGSVLFEDIKRSDGNVQRRLGPIRGSNVRKRISPSGQYSVPITYNLP